MKRSCDLQMLNHCYHPLLPIVARIEILQNSFHGNPQMSTKVQHPRQYLIAYIFCRKDVMSISLLLSVHLTFPLSRRSFSSADG